MKSCGYKGIPAPLERLRLFWGLGHIYAAGTNIPRGKVLNPHPECSASCVLRVLVQYLTVAHLDGCRAIAAAQRHAHFFDSGKFSEGALS